MSPSTSSTGWVICYGFGIEHCRRQCLYRIRAGRVRCKRFHVELVVTVAAVERRVLTLLRMLLGTLRTQDSVALRADQVHGEPNKHAKPDLLSTPPTLPPQMPRSL